MDVLGGVGTGAANDDLAVLLVPLQNGARAYTQFSPNLGRYGDLALGGQL